ncbi:MAG TPA: hypothetical protein VK044_07845 [Virgibacillus sp.]|nr:hypothetical protein [Virgibacillus sp.]
MVKRMLTILFFAFFIACSKEEPIIMKKEMKTTDEHQPALIEEEKEDEVDALIEFTFPEEQVIINLKNIPILNEYLQATNDKEKAIRNMDLIPIETEENDIFLLEFSCENEHCSYLLLHQDTKNQAYLVADLARYSQVLFSPDHNKALLKFDRNADSAESLTDLIVIDIQNWQQIQLLTPEEINTQILNFQWPITANHWIDNQSISVSVPMFSELDDELISQEKEIENQTTDITFYLDD